MCDLYVDSRKNFRCYVGIILSMTQLKETLQVTTRLKEGDLGGEGINLQIPNIPPIYTYM